MSVLRRRRARAASSQPLLRPSTLLAVLLLCLDDVVDASSSTLGPPHDAASSPLLRGLGGDGAFGRALLAAAEGEGEGTTFCHDSASFLGVGNTQCLHHNLRTAVFLLAVIVAVSVGVERLIHFIRAVIECPQLRKIVNRMFEEVMIMGFLSMVIFTLNTSGAMRSLALNNLTATEQLHLYEFFHYIVFLTMIYFIAIVLLLLFIGTVVPKLVWEMKNHDQRHQDGGDSDLDDYDFTDDLQDGGNGTDQDDSNARRLRQSMIRHAAYMDRLDHTNHSTGSSGVDEGQRTLDTPSEDNYESLRAPQRSGTFALRARAPSGMDLVLGSRAYSLLLQRYQREGWGFRFNLRKQWNLWKSFEILAYNICQNRSGYIYKNPMEMERLFGVRPSPVAPPPMPDSLDVEREDGGLGTDDDPNRMTYAKYHVLCMRNLLLHMTNLHPSAFLILIVICLLPALVPDQAHWIFIGVGGLLLLVNVVIFFKVLKILRGIVDDRLRVITTRDIQARLDKVLKASRGRSRRHRRRHGGPTATPDSSSVSVSAEECNENLSPGAQKLQNVLQARRKKGPIKFKAAALAVRAVIRMQMSALCHRQLHYHDDRFWFNSPQLLLRLFQFATIGQAFYLVWLSLVEAQSVMGASASQGGGSALLVLMVLLPAITLCVITPLTMPSLVLVMSLTGIFVDLNAGNDPEDGRGRVVTQEESKTRMRIMRRSFLKSHHTDNGDFHPPPKTPPLGPGAASVSPVSLVERDVMASPTNVFLRIYDSPTPSPASRRSGYYPNNSNSFGLRRGHSSSVGSIGSASGALDDSGYSSSHRAFNLAAFQSSGSTLDAAAANSGHNPSAQSASSFTSTSSSSHWSPSRTKLNDSSGPGVSLNWSQASVSDRTEAAPKASKSKAKRLDVEELIAASREQVASPVSASFKSYCSKYGGYPDL
ncbi:hypothetical protein BBJ28_00007238 [Nothophytophthora sp. Chile5]|nr:hypothetical protein BBJ28_00007238 [Nothophytophthora sp. Chile5]